MSDKIGRPSALDIAIGTIDRHRGQIRRPDRPAGELVLPLGALRYKGDRGDDLQLYVQDWTEDRRIRSDTRSMLSRVDTNSTYLDYDDLASGRGETDLETRDTLAGEEFDVAYETCRQAYEQRRQARAQERARLRGSGDGCVASVWSTELDAEQYWGEFDFAIDEVEGDLEELKRCQQGIELPARTVDFMDSCTSQLETLDRWSRMRDPGEMTAQTIRHFFDRTEGTVVTDSRILRRTYELVEGGITGQERLRAAHLFTEDYAAQAGLLMNIFLGDDCALKLLAHNVLFDAYHQVAQAETAMSWEANKAGIRDFAHRIIEMQARGFCISRMEQAGGGILVGHMGSAAELEGYLRTLDEEQTQAIITCFEQDQAAALDIRQQYEETLEQDIEAYRDMVTLMELVEQYNGYRAQLAALSAKHLEFMDVAIGRQHRARYFANTLDLYSNMWTVLQQAQIVMQDILATAEDLHPAQATALEQAMRTRVGDGLVSGTISWSTLQGDGVLDQMLTAEMAQMDIEAAIAASQVELKGVPFEVRPESDETSPPDLGEQAQAVFERILREEDSLEGMLYMTAASLGIEMERQAARLTRQAQASLRDIALARQVLGDVYSSFISRLAGSLTGDRVEFDQASLVRAADEIDMAALNLAIEELDEVLTDLASLVTESLMAAHRISQVQGDGQEKAQAIMTLVGVSAENAQAILKGSAAGIIYSLARDKKLVAQTWLETGSRVLRGKQQGIAEEKEREEHAQEQRLLRQRQDMAQWRLDNALHGVDNLRLQQKNWEADFLEAAARFVYDASLKLAERSYPIDSVELDRHIAEAERILQLFARVETLPGLPSQVGFEDLVGQPQRMDVVNVQDQYFGLLFTKVMQSADIEELSLNSRKLLDALLTYRPTGFMVASPCRVGEGEKAIRFKAGKVALHALCRDAIHVRGRVPHTEAADLLQRYVRQEGDLWSLRSDTDDQNAGGPNNE